MKKTSFFFILFLLLSISLAQATIYYVRADGTAANSVAAIGPCSVVANTMNLTVRNAATFSPGDTIKWCDTGGRYRGTFNPLNSGTSGLPITDIAETGHSPIISGSDIGTGFVDQGNNVWRLTPVVIEPKVVFFNDVLGTVVADTPNAANEWKWASNNLDVYYKSNPDGLIEAGQRAYGIQVTNKNYLNFSNLTVKGANSHGMLLGGGGVGTGIIVDGVNSSYNGGSGIDFSYQTYGAVKNSTCTYNAGSGISVINGVTDSTFENNQLTYNGRSVSSEWAGIRLVAPAAHPEYITRNIVQNNNCSNSFNAKGVWLDTVGVDNIVRYNSIKDNVGTGVFVEITSSAQVYYNIISGNSIYGIALAGGSGEGRFPATNNEFYNNIVWGSGLIGFYMFNEDNIQGSTYNNSIKNNIFVGTVAGPELSVKYKADLESNTLTYNCLGTEKSNFVEWGSSFKSTYADWETVVGETYSTKGDPLFQNSPTNFQLSLSSPCLNRGTPVGLIRDFLGTTVPIGDSPDIGAYEYPRVPPKAIKQIWARIPATAGEALVAGYLVALADADGYAYKANANLLTRIPAVGIVERSATAGAKVEIITFGIVSGWTGLTEGAPGYLSGTAGAITQTAPKVTYSQQVGVAISTTEYLINPASGPYSLGTPSLLCTASHNYGGAAADWNMLAVEAACSFISVTNASGAVNAILPAAQPGKSWVITNGSGGILTFKVTGGTGGTIANNKAAMYMGHATDVSELYEQP